MLMFLKKNVCEILIFWILKIDVVPRLEMFWINCKNHGKIYLIYHTIQNYIFQQNFILQGKKKIVRFKNWKNITKLYKGINLLLNVVDRCLLNIFKKQDEISGSSLI